jgi:hypothetical protein
LDTFIETLKYRVTAVDGSGETVVIEADGGGTTIPLKEGDWAITAEAYVSSDPGTTVGSGSSNVTIVAGQNVSREISMTVAPAYEKGLTVIYIHNEADLRRIGATENGLAIDDPNRAFYLENDIVLTEPWTPIGNGGAPFKAAFDGQGHTITVRSFAGTKKADNAVYLGFFALVEDAAIKNITIKYELDGQVDISTGAGSTYSGSHAGGAAGRADNASFENIHVAGNFSVKADGNGELNVGGIAGKTGGSTGSSIKASYVTGIVEGITPGGNSNSGGIAGVTGGKDLIENCYVWAAVSSGAGSKETAGGIAGTNDGVISKCYASGTVQSKGTNPAVYIGGIAGYGGGTGRVGSCAALVSKLDGGPSTSTSKSVRAISGYGAVSGNYSRSSIIYNRTGSPDPGAGNRDGRQEPLAGFKSQTLYAAAGWDFTAGTGDWKFLPGCDYPVLSWQTTAPQSGFEDAPEGGAEIEIGWP